MVRIDVIILIIMMCIGAFMRVGFRRIGKSFRVLDLRFILTYSKMHDLRKKKNQSLVLNPLGVFATRGIDSPGGHQSGHHKTKLHHQPS